jgi:hypothetical protein
MATIRGGERWSARVQRKTLQDFVEVLYGDIDDIFKDIEESPQHRQNDTEDRLTDEIKIALRRFGYVAEHDPQRGGHVDLTVSDTVKPWTWLGEAKHYGSICDLREGFLQLATRYSNGDPSDNQGGILAYLKRPNAARQMKRWQDSLSSLRLRKLSIAACHRRSGLAFYSMHEHGTSGMPYRVRHMCLMLYFAPADKSGRRSRKTAKRSRRKHN